ncbi:MAG: ATP synthase F1 subunit delta [Flavobacteriales bacterium]|nr:ATP synthase F1 subunit delta [Flavobacteriales bacterium]
MKSAKSASRYAKALLELAVDQQKVEAIESNMQRILTAAKETNEFQVFLNSPIINIDKKIDVLNKLFGEFEPLTLSFIALITKNGRERFITEIAHSYISQVKEYKGIVPITITSARALDAATKANIIAKISATVKGTLEITEIVDETIVGGFVVRMGDKQFDASVATQLLRMKQELSK